MGVATSTPTALGSSAQPQQQQCNPVSVTRPFQAGSVRCLADFPEHLVLVILSLLPLDHAFMVYCVCRSLRATAVNLTVLRLVGPPYLKPRRLRHIISTFRNVRELHVRFPGNLSLETTTTLIRGFPSVHTFSLSGTCLRNEQVQLLLRTLPKLVNLELSGLSFIPTGILLRLARRYTMLESLNLSGCRTLDDKAASAICSSAKMLNNLILHGCTQLRSPMFTGRLLSRVELRECATLTSPAFDDVPCLTHLDLSSCRKLPDVNVQRCIDSCPALRWLSLSGCHALTNLDIRADGLRHLDLALCTQLCSLGVGSDSLMFIDVGMCVELRRLTLNLSAIRSLNLGMLRLSTLCLRCDHLEELLLHGCRDLEEMDILCPETTALLLSGSGLNKDVLGDVPYRLIDDHMPTTLVVD